MSELRHAAMLKLRDSEGKRAGICMDDPGRILITVNPIGGEFARSVDVVVWPEHYPSPVFDPGDDCPSVCDANLVTFKAYPILHFGQRAMDIGFMRRLEPDVEDDGFVTIYPRLSIGPLREETDAELRARICRVLEQS